MSASERNPEATTPFRRDPVSWIAAASAVISIATWALFASNRIWGDDWALYAQALRGAGLMAPISSHFRPLARLQFAAFAIFPSPTLFHFISLAVHLLAAWSVWRYLRSRESARVARIASLLFAGCFLANEAVYWISATGPVLCLLFTLLAAAAWRERRPFLASLFLFAATMSYELWLVGLVLLLFEGARPWRHLAGPALVLALFLSVQVFVVGSGSLTSYGGTFGRGVVQRMALCAFRAISPLSEPPGLLLGAVTIVLLLALGGVSRYRLPVAFYFAAVAILSLSSMMSSRFYYVPQLALVWIAARAIEDVRWARIAATAFIVWFVLIGAIVNVLDGVDYRRLGRFEEQIATGVERAVGPLHEGDFVELDDRTPDQTVRRMGARLVGRPKLWFNRPGAIHGAIDPADLATILFARQGYRALPVQPGSGRRIEIGSTARPRVSAYHAVR